MKTTTIEVRISEVEKERFQALAEKEGRSLSEFVRDRLANEGVIVGTAGEINLADVKRQADSVWFMQQVWPKILDNTIKRACGEYRLTGKLPLPPSNGAGTLAHEEGCDCRRCSPPKEEKKAASSKS